MPQTTATGNQLLPQVQPLPTGAGTDARKSPRARKKVSAEPTPPISASASPVQHRTPTPGSVPSPGMTRVPTPDAAHPVQQLEVVQKTVKQSSPLPPTLQSPMTPTACAVVPSPHSTGKIVIQHSQGPQGPLPAAQQPAGVLQQQQPQQQQGPLSSKPHPLKVQVLNAINQQQPPKAGKHIQQHQPTGNKPQPQPQIIFKSALPYLAIHTTTGKQFHPSSNIKTGPQIIQQGAPQHTQQIIIQNTMSQPNQITKPGQPQGHHPPGTGNLLINIPQNKPHQVLITNSKPPVGGPLSNQPQQQQQQYSPHIIHKLPAGKSQPQPQQIIIQGGKIPPGHHQIPMGYTTVMQSGTKIIHRSTMQSPTQAQPHDPGQPSPQQQQMAGKHATQTILIGQFQPQTSQPSTTIVHKTITTSHGGQQHIKIGGPEALAQMQPVYLIGKQQLIQPMGTAVGRKMLPQQPSQIQHQQNQPVGLTRLNHIGPAGRTTAGGQQQQQKQPHPQQLTIQQGKGVPSHLHQPPQGIPSQIMTGAVASPPLKHMHSQQPILTGASSPRVAMPAITRQGMLPGQQPPPASSSTAAHLRHVQQGPGLNVPPQVAYEANPHGDLVEFIGRGQSPPPTHQQQTSSITPTDAAFRRGMQRDYVKYMYSRNIPRSPLLPGSVEQRELSEMKESVATSPPLKLRRPSSGPRPTTAVPPSLQSPGDRSTDSPQVAYIGTARIPHSSSVSLNTRFYDPEARGPNAPPRALSTEPPPAHHRPHNLSTSGVEGFPPGSYPGTSCQTPSPASPASLSQLAPQQQQQRDRDLLQLRDRVTMPGHAGAVLIKASPLPAHGGIPGVIPAGRTAVAPPISVASGSTGGGNTAIVPPQPQPTSQPTPQSDSLDQLLLEPAQIDGGKMQPSAVLVTESTAGNATVKSMGSADRTAKQDRTELSEYPKPKSLSARDNSDDDSAAKKAKRATDHTTNKKQNATAKQKRKPLTKDETLAGPAKPAVNLPLRKTVTAYTRMLDIEQIPELHYSSDSDTEQNLIEKTHLKSEKKTEKIMKIPKPFIPTVNLPQKKVIFSYNRPLNIELIPELSISVSEPDIVLENETPIEMFEPTIEIEQNKMLDSEIESDDFELPYTFFKNNNFDILYCHVGKIPRSAKYHIFKNNLVVFFKRPSSYTVERRIPGMHCTTINDFKGKEDIIAFHYVPSAAMHTESAKKAVNVLINLAPANRDLNGGLWWLMEKEDMSMANFYDEVIVMVGTLNFFVQGENGEYTKIIHYTQGKVEIHEAFYRARACRKGNKWYLTYRYVLNKKPDYRTTIDDCNCEPLFVFQCATKTVNNKKFDYESFKKAMKLKPEFTNKTVLPI